METYASGEYFVIKLPRRFKHPETTRFSLFIKDKMAEGTSRFGIDAAETEFIDSTGIGLLVTLLRDVMKMNGDMYIINLHGSPLELFRQTGLDDMLPIKEGDTPHAMPLDLLEDINSPEMNFLYEQLGGVAIFHFKGTVNNPGAMYRFTEQALTVMKDTNKILLNFTAVTSFDDVMAAREIARIYRILKTSNGELRFSNPGNLVQDLREILGADAEIKTYASVGEALKDW
jgi:anti-sigma B factor antagonist